MAGKNQVLLTFAGDATKLDKTMKDVGAGAESMGKDAKTGAGGLDRLGEAGGTTETRFLGLGAGISGVSTLLAGDLNAETAAMAFADLGDAVEHTVVPLLAQGKQLVANGAQALVTAGQHVAAAATTAASWIATGAASLVAGAQMAAAWLIGLGPVALVILAIGAVIGILVALGVSFDDVKRFAVGVFNWIKGNWPLLLAILTGPFGLAVLAISRNWDTIKRGASAVKDWIFNRVEDIVGFFTGMPGRITSAFSSLGSGVAAAFKSAWNSSLGGLVVFPGFNPPGPGSLPRITIPTLHQGGTMPGAPGTEGLALLQAGERVTRAGAAQAPTVVINVAGSITSERDLVKVVRDELTRGGFGGAF